MAVPMKTTNGNRKLILDVDTGIDDALALAYLASFNNIEILGVIGTYGNVAADTAVYNTAYVLERLGFRNVPVLRGSTRPSWAASFIPDAGCAQFHGTDGLGGFGPAVGSPAVACVSDSGETDIWKSDSAPYVSDSAESDIQSTTNTVYASDSGESDHSRYPQHYLCVRFRRIGHSSEARADFRRRIRRTRPARESCRRFVLTFVHDLRWRCPLPCVTGRCAIHRRYGP